MALFRMPRFIRRWLRRNMHPMAEHSAAQWKQRLSILYMIIAWQAGGLVLYQIFVKGNVHWPKTAGLTNPEDDMLTSAAYYSKRLNIPNATVYTVSGLSVKEREIKDGKLISANEDQN